MATAPKKTSLLDVARGNLDDLLPQDDERAPVRDEAPVEAPPKAPPARKAPTRKAPAPRTQAAPASRTQDEPSEAPARPRSKPAPDPDLFTRFLEHQDADRLLAENGFARSDGMAVLNMQQPIAIRHAMDAWVAREHGRTRKNLVNALLVAYLSQTGDLTLPD